MSLSSSLLDRRALLIGSGALALAGCATRPASPDAPAGTLTLDQAFRGRTRGIGLFSVPIAGVERRFTAKLDGRRQGDRLTIVEDFFFDDGEVDRLTWRFRRSGQGRWTGRREDTVGEATAIETGSEIRLEYVADVRSKGQVTRLGFADVIYRRADGVIINDAVVTRLGVPVGTVRFELRR
jgi:hypothetical protein